MDRATVGTAAHGNGQAWPGHQAAAHHEVNAGQDDVGQHSDSQHADQDKAVDGVDLHDAGNNQSSASLAILFTSGSKLIDIEAA